MSSAIIELTAGQYNLVYNLFSLTIAGMAAAFVFFLGARSQVDARFRKALLVSAVVVGVACYHYFRIFESWGGAVADTKMVEGTMMYMFNTAEFNDAYRYADWLVTVPLLLVEVVAVLGLSKRQERGFVAKLSIAAIAMLALGYPGEIATETGPRLLWGTLSTIPFVYILYVLWVELGDAIEDQPGHAQVLLRNLRLLLLATWGFYPIAYLAPVIGLGDATGLVALQVGYSIADLAAKAGFGLMIFSIAKTKSETAPAAQGAPAAAE